MYEVLSEPEFWLIFRPPRCDLYVGVFGEFGISCKHSKCERAILFFVDVPVVLDNVLFQIAQVCFCLLDDVKMFETIRE